MFVAGKGHNGPLIIHALSNQGIYQYGSLVDELLREDRKGYEALCQRVKATIVDSAPSYLTNTIVTRGYTGFLTSQRSHVPDYDSPLYNAVFGALLRPVVSLRKVRFPRLPLSCNKDLLLIHSVD